MSAEGPKGVSGKISPIEMIMKSMNLSKVQAMELIKAAANNPKDFQTRQDVINAMRHKTAPMDKVKGIQIRNTQAPRRRNALCSCGSGKKIKNCACYKKEKIVGLVFHREKEVDTKGATTGRS